VADRIRTVAEDLTREHGVLKRVLLVYREVTSVANSGSSCISSYEPPEAREHTVRFPAFKKIVSKYEASKWNQPGSRIMSHFGALSRLPFGDRRSENP
jgi:hypothetical protein